MSEPWILVVESYVLRRFNGEKIRFGKSFCLFFDIFC